RIRRNSLTTAAATGLKTPERERVMKLLHARARENAELAAAGAAPALEPIADAPPVGLRRLAGPALLRASGTPAEREPAPKPVAPPRRGGPPRPVFVIGAARCGASALAWALGQHPALPAVIDSAWVADLARE